MKQIQNFKFGLIGIVVLIILKKIMGNKYNSVANFLGIQRICRAWFLIGSRLKFIIEENMVLQALITGQIAYFLQSSIREIFIYVWEWFHSFYSSITIENTDRNFDAILLYSSLLCNKTNKNNSSNTALIATTADKNISYAEKYRNFLLGQREADTLDYRPANAQIRTFHYRGHRVLMSRNKGEVLTIGWERSPKQMETLTLSVWGKNNDILKDFFQEALMYKVKEDSKGVQCLMQNSEWPYGWIKCQIIKPRMAETVILDGDKSEKLLRDVKNFLDNRKWYENRNIPYRRGYLLYGPPGSGKTSFAQVIASELKLDICILSLSNSELNDNNLAKEIRKAPKNALVLLEDVDAVFVQRERKVDNLITGGGGKGNNLSFSGLLNAIDGVSAGDDGRIILMTTNHIERLDPALIRPGRCDVKVELNNASKNQLKRIFTRFYPNFKNETHLKNTHINSNTKNNNISFNSDSDAAEIFALSLPEFELSMAEVQGFLMRHETSQEALKNLNELLLKVSSLSEEENDKFTSKMSRRTTIFDFLERLDLESLCLSFYQANYFYADEVINDNLEVSTIENWNIELLYDHRLRRRLSMLLTKDKINNYALVPISEIKDFFLEKFGNDHNLKHVMAIEKENFSASKWRARLNSLANDFCMALSKREENDTEDSNNKSRKPTISYYQLQKLFNLKTASRSPEYCVEEAKIYSMQREKRKLDFQNMSKKIKNENKMTTWQWMQRAGLEHTIFAAQFERKGFHFADSILNLEDDDLEAIGIHIPEVGYDDENESDILHLLKMKDPSNELESMLISEFALASRNTIREQFESYFPGHGPKVTDIFESALINELGYSKVSLIQLKKQLSFQSLKENETKFREISSSDLKNIFQSWFQFKKIPIPEIEEEQIEETWLLNWLKSNGLDAYHSNFLDAALTTKEDIFSEPIITLTQIENLLNIKALGHQRKIISIIKAEIEKHAKSI